MALKVFVKELQLDNEDLLQGKVEIRKIPTNTYVMREDSHKVCCIFYIFRIKMIQIFLQKKKAKKVNLINVISNRLF